MDRIGALLTGASQWIAERQARRANQGIFSALGRTRYGLPYDAGKSIEQQLGPMSDAQLQQLGPGWEGGSVRGTLGDLGNVHQYEAQQLGRNYQANRRDFGTMADTLGTNLNAYGQAMRGAVGRYGADISKAWETPYQNALGYANQMGAQQQADIRQNWANQQAATAQQLGRMGLGNTTVGSSMAAGNTRLMQSDLNRLAESLAGMKLNIEGTMGSNLASARERGYGAQMDVESALAGAQRGLGDWRAQALYGMDVGNREASASLGSRQGREMLDTKRYIAGEGENLMYAPNVTAADQSGAVNAATSYGYASVPPYQPSGLFGSPGGMAGIGAVTGAVLSPSTAIPFILGDALIGAGIGYGVGSM